MANVFNCCKECGLIFQSTIPVAYCPAHKYIDDQQFDKIEEYLELHPLSNALQISNDINVPTSEILRYINEGKLVVVDGKVNLK